MRDDDGKKQSLMIMERQRVILQALNKLTDAPMSTKNIADVVGYHRTSVSNWLIGLAVDGLVDRFVAKNGFSWRINDAGRAVLTEDTDHAGR